MNRQADLIDQATANIDAEMSYIVQRHAQRKRAVKTDYCEECGEFIPLIRQEATGGTDHCAECLSIKERKR